MDRPPGTVEPEGGCGLGDAHPGIACESTGPIPSAVESPTRAGRGNRGRFAVWTRWGGRIYGGGDEIELSAALAARPMRLPATVPLWRTLTLCPGCQTRRSPQPRTSESHGPSRLDPIHAVLCFRRRLDSCRPDRGSTAVLKAALAVRGRRSDLRSLTSSLSPLLLRPRAAPAWGAGGFGLGIPSARRA
jgi:hypothetical protein